MVIQLTLRYMGIVIIRIYLTIKNTIFICDEDADMNICVILIS